MLKICTFVIIATAVFALSSAHPAYKKEFDKIVNSNDCLKSCMSNLTNFDEEISLLKNPNFQRYFGKLDQICELISSIRVCIDGCGIESNPFALESMNVICFPETREKVNEITDCLNTKSTDIYQTCATACGDYNAVSEETHQLTQNISESELKDNEKVNSIMDKSNQACGMYKCLTRCSVDMVKSECDKNIASEFQTILQQIFDAQYSDLQKLNLINILPKTVAPECNYMYDPSVIFGPLSNNHESGPQDAISKLQIELLLQQLKLADRQDELINRENQKLNMEMELLSQKAMGKKQRTFENPRFVFQ
jgi:hypothetical protein